MTLLQKRLSTAQKAREVTNAKTLTAAVALAMVPAFIRTASSNLNLSRWSLERQMYFNGDYWQKSSGWTGPLPEGTPQLVVDEIERYFTSANKIREVSDRHLDAVIGKDPRWSWVPIEAPEPTQEKDPLTGLDTTVKGTQLPKDEAKTKQLDAFYTDWLEQHDVFWRIRENADALLWNESLIMRMYIPDFYMNDAGQLPMLPFAESLSRVRIMVVSASMGQVVYDHTDEPIGSIYRYQGGGLDGESEVIEYSWVDRQSQMTQLLQIDSKSKEWTHIEFDLGGQLMMFEIRRKHPFITRQMVQLTSQMAVALTMAGRNVVQGGFLERVLLNAELPGEYQDIRQPDGTTKRKFVPDDLISGPNSFLAIMGAEKFNPETDEPTGDRLTPSMLWKDPVSVQTFVDSLNLFEKQLYSEAKQLHVTINGDATASGVSRIQALQDFVMSLEPTSRQFTRGYRWMFNLAHRFASGYSSEPIDITGLKPMIQLRRGTDFLSPEDKKLVLEQVAAGLLSEESAMGLLGVEDPDAEKLMIASERNEKAAHTAAVQDATLKVDNANIPPEPKSPVA